MKPCKAAASYAADLQHAYDYFKQGGQKAADRFWRRYRRTRAVVQSNPFVGRLRSTGWRQMTISGSNYAIFYRETPGFWFLGGVISTVQDPDVIQARLLIREIHEEEER